MRPRARARRGVAAAGLALGVLLACAETAAEDPWFAAGRKQVADAARETPLLAQARNVVLFVGDGMGISTVTAARILQGQRRGQPGEENQLSFERFPHTALVKTYNTNQQTPDSAGTMTALVTGAKTRAGVLSVASSVARGDPLGAREAKLTTLFERAEARGMATGVVTTTRVTHATPAACYAHAPERDWEVDTQLSEAARSAAFPDIARQLLEHEGGDGLEVALGGGRAHFLPATAADPEYPERRGARGDGRDLTAEWLASRPGAAWVWKREQLQAADPAKTARLLGLFEPGHMRFGHDRAGDPGGEPSLAEMTAWALDRLSRERRGFVLMVEAGRIDHAHHVVNAFRALDETIELSNAVDVALEKTDPRHTLMLVTADHSHTLTLAGYATRGNDILGLVRSNDHRGEPRQEPSLDAFRLPYTVLGYRNGPHGAIGSELGPESAPLRRDLREVDLADPDFRQEVLVPLRRETHAGEDVAVYALGPGAQLVRGVREQSYLYHVIHHALGW